MCGLFGMILPHRYPTDLLHRDAALAFLGVLAEERGRHGAGIAIGQVSGSLEKKKEFEALCPVPPHQMQRGSAAAQAEGIGSDLVQRLMKPENRLLHFRT